MTRPPYTARCIAATVAGALAIAFALAAPSADAAKTTECTKVGACYCVNDELKTAIGAKVDRFRQQVSEQRTAGKLVGYLSVPLTSTAGSNFNVNREIAESIKAAIEKRYGSDLSWVLNPATPEADLPKGAGADYMLLWTRLMEGNDGLGEFDFVYFAGPQDFARYFGFDGNADMAKLDTYFDKRVASNADFAKASQNGLTKSAFRKYYGLRASVAVSRGAHDEWNILRQINERRRTDPTLGIGSQIPAMFDGHAIDPANAETSVSEGYVGKCVP